MKAWIPAALLSAAAVPAAVAAEPSKAAAPSSPTARDAGPSPATPGRDEGLTFGANQVTGRLASFNSSDKTVVIDEGGRRQNLRLTEDTTVFVDGRLGSATDLKEGVDVRAAFEPEGEPPRLRWIEVAPTKQASTGTSEAKAFVGHIAEIDPKAHQVTISHGDDRRTFQVTGSTKILNQGQPASMDSLKEGQEVRAAFTPSKGGGPATASQLEIVIDPSQQAPKPPPTKTQPPETTY